MVSRLARRQTLASFDYQWRHLPEGDAMLSDPWFEANAGAILADALLGVDPAWLAGRTALDAGCGGGRWTVALLRQGCRVLAVDGSEGALDATRRQAERLVPDATSRLETARVDLLDPPRWLLERTFDVVFSFGVLHHTGDTRLALGHLAPRVSPGGILFLYLYGPPAAGRGGRWLLRAARTALFPIPFRAKRLLLRAMLPGRDVHQAFDLLSPLVNDTSEFATVESWVRALGFPDVTRMAEHRDVFLRATRGTTPSPPLGPPPAPPYWFDRYRRR